VDPHVTETEGAIGGVEPFIGQAISRLMTAALWVARLLLPLGIVALVAAVVTWIAIPLQWVNDGGWKLGVSIGAGVLLLVPGVWVLRVRGGLRDAAAHEENVKDDVSRLLAATADQAAIRARIQDAVSRLGGPNKLRTMMAIGRELLPLAKAARERHERYQALVEAFGPAGLGALGTSVGLAIAVIVAAPIALVVGLVLFLL